VSRHFADRLADAIAARRTPAVVGIDPVLERLPTGLRPRDGSLASACEAVEAFARGVIDAVAAIVPAVKINSAFFEAFYDRGVAAYYRLIRYAHRRGLLVIGDVKRGDIGSTARLYACGHLVRGRFADWSDENLPDAATLAGYLGRDSVQPFIDAAARQGTSVFVLVRPSNPSADEIHEFGGHEPLYLHLARCVHAWGSVAELRGACGLSCVGAVVAAKDVASTRALRKAMPHTLWLVPGYGAQGASLDACRACFRAAGDGALISASRSVIYAFEDKATLARHAGDWQACVAEAARRFARDIATCAASAGGAKP